MRRRWTCQKNKNKNKRCNSGQGGAKTTQEKCEGGKKSAKTEIAGG